MVNRALSDGCVRGGNDRAPVPRVTPAPQGFPSSKSDNADRHNHTSSLGGLLRGQPRQRTTRRLRGRSAEARYVRRRTRGRSRRSPAP